MVLIYFVNIPVVMDAWRMKSNTNKPSKATNGSNGMFEDDSGVMKLAESQSESLKVQKLWIKCKTSSTKWRWREGDIDIYNTGLLTWG